ncbi:MAG: alpha/beta hydrolase [Rhodothermales bacterium]|nr:alpha/beta hydrolase [Rhodothermales bacterium]
MGSDAFIPDVSDWLRRGTFVTVGTDRRWTMFVQDFGDASAPPEATALLLHGFPESSFSYNRVLEGLLRVFRRVVAPDFLGFGFSDKPEGHPNSIVEQVDLLENMFAELSLRGAHVIAHDMGSAAACEMLHRHFEEASSSSLTPYSVTLTNAPLVSELVTPGLLIRMLRSKSYGELTARLTVRTLFGRQIRRANGTRKLSREDILHMWEILAVSGGHRRVHLLMRYVDDRDRFEQTRWLPSIRLACEASIPVRLVWGDADRIDPVDMAHHIKDTWCPSASLRVIQNGGHFLQLDSPEDWLGAVLPPFLRTE